MQQMAHELWTNSEMFKLTSKPCLGIYASHYFSFDLDYKESI